VQADRFVTNDSRLTTSDSSEVALAPQIAVTRLSHSYPGEAGAPPLDTLVDVALDVKKSELVCLIGPSGCGKSTLLNIIGGLVRPGSGEVRISGVPVTGPSPQKVAYVFQENSLFPWNTIQENLLVALEFQGVSKELRKERARDALEAVGLADFADHYPHQLSGGMKQRASLARALSLHTDILLMDEPFAALDEQTRTYLGEELSWLLAKANKTIVFVTHSLTEAVFLSDRIIVFTARPAAVKAVLKVDQEHPRDPRFMNSPEFSELRNTLYALLREEIQKTVGATLIDSSRTRVRDIKS
jgi:NitT/TauT family transport system ATP-binding protein